MNTQYDEALRVICGYIEEYERAKDPSRPFPSFNKEEYESKCLPAMIAAGTTVLSAAAGRDYHWSRGKRKDGAEFSGIVIHRGEGDYEIVSENYAGSGKNI